MYRCCIHGIWKPPAEKVDIVRWYRCCLAYVLSINHCPQRRQGKLGAHAWATKSRALVLLSLFLATTFLRRVVLTGATTRFLLDDFCINSGQGFDSVRCRAGRA
jgi:hypothetical protein